jgi:hypothetical protein
MANTQVNEIILYQPENTVKLEVRLENETVYHIGASLKDLGKKLFAFTRMTLGAEELLRKVV